VYFRIAPIVATGGGMSSMSDMMNGVSGGKLKLQDGRKRGLGFYSDQSLVTRLELSQHCRSVWPGGSIDFPGVVLRSRKGCGQFPEFPEPDLPVAVRTPRIDHVTERERAEKACQASYI